MLTINTNLSSIITQNSLKTSTQRLNQAIERMSTGFKINHAKDNAANYSISTNIQTKLNAYNVAADNVAMGMDLITTASDTISLMQDYGTRLQALATQARNGTYGSESLEAINAEVGAIMKEIDRLSSTAEYNGVSLFEGGSEGNGFISDPVTYSEAEVKAMTTMTELVNGTTSVDNTYSISSAKELEALAKYVNDGNSTSGMTFVLGANIDLSSISNWTPIGNATNIFEGTFDGNGHIIKNLKIDSAEDYQGLFGYSLGSISNVGVENSDVKGGEFVAGLVGRTEEYISNCYTNGNVSGEMYVGGLVGSGSAAIYNCYSTCDVSGDECLGGLAGSTSGYITGNYASGDVTGINNVGGLIGYALMVNSCYASGDVTGINNVGGLVGSANTVAYCYATGNVTCSVVGGGKANSADWDGTKFNYETGTFSVNLDGSNIGAYTLQVGINGDESCRLDLNTSFFYMLGAVKRDISSDRALEAINNFTSQMSEKSTQLGAVQNRLESALDSIEVNISNLTSSLSTIRDADIAEVSSEYIRQQILQQASATLLATANQSPSIALQLI